MAFRTIIVATHSKLEYSLNYFIYRTLDEIKRINLDEIQTVIIESTEVSITSALLVELNNRKIKVIFCDEKKNPCFETIPYYGDSISPKRINEQMSWNSKIKGVVWKEIVKQKIINQAKSMSYVNDAIANQIKNYASEVEEDDITNREGHAAKIYFNNIFGDRFNRGNESININKYLNYGYSIILSQINRCVVSKGYITQLGIHHKSEFNQFNLSCDLMEPFRPLVDMKASNVNDSNFKDEMVKLLNFEILINKEKQTVANAINIYCSSVFRALNNEDPDELIFYEL